jgi:hypothetical protein
VVVYLQSLQKVLIWEKLLVGNNSIYKKSCQQKNDDKMGVFTFLLLYLCKNFRPTIFLGEHFYLFFFNEFEIGIKFLLFMMPSFCSDLHCLLFLQPNSHEADQKKRKQAFINAS